MLLESLPDDVVASLEVRDQWRKSVASGGSGLEFIVSDLSRWTPGAPVRVAFLDGTPDLHRQVRDATAQITDACALRLDFGEDESAGTLRRWTEQDTSYAAEIRVSFDLPGYFSLVGTDSTDRSIGIGGPVGGGPGQRSLNLGGYADRLPEDWEGTVRHEFLHALAFHHAHQNLRGPCETEFRWEDDPGYRPTMDDRGAFVPDGDGRRPGIYTYLAGAPNRWPRAKVDHNLRTDTGAGVVVGPFDPDSVMLYAFEPFFYHQDPSPCAPTGNGVDLSDGDRRGLQLLYPGAPQAQADIAQRAAQALDRISATRATESTLGSGAQDGSAYLGRVEELLGALASR